MSLVDYGQQKITVNLVSQWPVTNIILTESTHIYRLNCMPH